MPTLLAISKSYNVDRGRRDQQVARSIAATPEAMTAQRARLVRLWAIFRRRAPLQKGNVGNDAPTVGHCESERTDAMRDALVS